MNVPFDVLSKSPETAKNEHKMMVVSTLCIVFVRDEILPSTNSTHSDGIR